MVDVAGDVVAFGEELLSSGDVVLLEQHCADVVEAKDLALEVAAIAGDGQPTAEHIFGFEVAALVGKANAEEVDRMACGFVISGLHVEIVGLGPESEGLVAEAEALMLTGLLHQGVGLVAEVASGAVVELDRQLPLDRRAESACIRGELGAGGDRPQERASHQDGEGSSGLTSPRQQLHDGHFLVLHRGAWVPVEASRSRSKDRQEVGSNLRAHPTLSHPIGLDHRQVAPVARFFIEGLIKVNIAQISGQNLFKGSSRLLKLGLDLGGGEGFAFGLEVGGDPGFAPVVGLGHDGDQALEGGELVEGLLDVAPEGGGSGFDRVLDFFDGGQVGLVDAVGGDVDDPVLEGEGGFVGATTTRSQI